MSLPIRVPKGLKAGPDLPASTFSGIVKTTRCVLGIRASPPSALITVWLSFTEADERSVTQYLGASLAESAKLEMERRSFDAMREESLLRQPRPPRTHSPNTWKKSTPQQSLLLFGSSHCLSV